jgi:hypothetical protein
MLVFIFAAFRFAGGVIAKPDGGLAPGRYTAMPAWNLPMIREWDRTTG